MALTVVYTNISTSDISTSPLDGNFNIKPGNSITLYSKNTSLDYCVGTGKMTRTINNVIDNDITDDGEIDTWGFKVYSKMDSTSGNKILESAGGNLTITDLHKPYITTYKDLQSKTEIGQSYFVRDVGAGLVEFQNQGFGWKPVKSFPLQPLFSEYTHTDAYADIGIPWSVTLPAGLLHLGYIEVSFLVTFPSSASSKTVAFKTNGTAIFNKTRTTSTHEAPVIIVNAKDSLTLNYPYTTNAVPISGGTGFTPNNISIDTRSSDLELRLETSFSVGANTGESIVTRYVRAKFNPF